MHMKELNPLPVKLRAVPLRALVLTALLMAFCVQTTSDRFPTMLRNEQLHRDFPDAQLVRPTDPPQSFNFDTKHWSEWPPARYDAPAPVDMPPEDIPVIPKRIKHE